MCDLNDSPAVSDDGDHGIYMLTLVVLMGLSFALGYLLRGWFA